MAHPITKLITAMTSVYKIKSAVRNVFYSPRHFPKILATTMVCSCVGGYQMMESIHQRRIEVSYSCLDRYGFCFILCPHLSLSFLLCTIGSTWNVRRSLEQLQGPKGGKLIPLVVKAFHLVCIHILIQSHSIYISDIMNSMKLHWGPRCYNNENWQKANQ